ncbi:MAG TPA: class IV adenylate cyclase [Gemmatimonadaceae bacterium]
MREVELKAVVNDVERRRALIEKAGAHLEFDGRLLDRRYGDPSGRLVLIDHVLRLRVYETDRDRHGYLDWKGPTQYDRGYKVREELSTRLADPDALAQILENLGYAVILEIDRHIWQYKLGKATIRFERYPRMDDLVEVEGSPESIEQGIAALEIDRTMFSADRLTDFVVRFEARTGEKAALSEAATNS